MALTPVTKGTWNSLYEISDQVIATLGRIVETNKKGSFFDLTTGAQVNTTDKYIRREHQYRPDMGPKRFSFRLAKNPPHAPVSIAVTPKVDIATDVQDPYIVVESLSLGEKCLVYLHEGQNVFQDQLLRMMDASEEKFASENKGELKSHCTIEFVIPRIAIYLKATKPHRVDRLNLETRRSESFATEIMAGCRLFGKLQKSLEETATAAVEEKKSPGKKSSKKSKKQSKAPAPRVSIEVKSTTGCTMASETLTNVELGALWETLNEYTPKPNEWQPIWLRSQTADEFLKSIPDVEEYPSLLVTGRFTVGPCPTLDDSAVLADSGIPRMMSCAKILGHTPGTVGNFYFSSRARGVAMVEQAKQVGERIAGRFSSEAPSCAFMGLAGYCSGLSCSKGHSAVPGKMTTLSRCYRCEVRTGCMTLKCGVCDEAGAVCSVCGVLGLAFCPAKHAVQVSAAPGHLPCDGCDKRGREISLVCPVGAHWARALCGECAGHHFIPIMLRALEPSPFEHCLAVTARVKILKASAQDADTYSRNQLPSLLGNSDGLTVATVYGNPEGFAEFRFTLQRKDPDEVSPYKRVIDYMLRTLDNCEAIVDIVEINSVRVSNPHDPKDLSVLSEWLERMD